MEYYYRLRSCPNALKRSASVVVVTFLFFRSNVSGQPTMVADVGGKNMLTGIDVVLILIILGLLFNRYVNRRRNDRKEVVHQKELDDKYTFLMTNNSEKDELLRHNKWLIKELNHRVKNNLQIITSLLHSQAVYVKDHAALAVVKDSLRRMQAISLCHQKLYDIENKSTIAMSDYINDLVEYLQESFDGNDQITIKQRIERVELDVKQAVPLGLIISESVVNSIKHAFPDHRKGIIEINLSKEADGEIRLNVSDNGKGLPESDDPATYWSLGFNLLQGLAKQLDGDFSIQNNNGVAIIVRFKVFETSDDDSLENEIV